MWKVIIDEKTEMMSRKMTYPILIFFVSMLNQTALSGQNGNVGIGTTSPSDALHILASQGENALRVQLNGTTRFRVLQNGGTTIGINNESSTPQNGLYVFGNTGLGIGNPNDRLEVDGNIDLTGALKVNGNAGQAGQVLMSDGSGGIDWEDVGSAFKNFKDFFNPDVVNTWTVPAGVDRVLVELWGAGAGGRELSGGGAGGYLKALLDVTPGDTYTITLGEGGIGQTSSASATNGGTTSITGYTFSPLQATGGIATGLGGSTSINPNIKAIRRRGNHGQPTRIRFEEYAPGSFAQIFERGNGGAAMYAPGSEGRGKILATVYNDLSSILFQSGVGSSSGTSFGAGGGGGGVNGEPTISSGGDGADGYAIIRW